MINNFASYKKNESSLKNYDNFQNISEMFDYLKS